jgi:predicted short-subunit dehydrogenase-like oxidoreductase (DUF2520 family)
MLAERGQPWPDATRPSGTREDWNEMDSAARPPANGATPSACGGDPGGDAGDGRAPERDPAGGVPPARLKVGVVGPGRVGAVLGAALARAGHPVVAASAVSAASRQRASAFLPGAAIREPAGVLAAADLVLLTVPDDALPGLIGGLAQTEAPLQGRLLVHTSGRYGASVLDAAARRGALPLAVHPVMTFTGRPEDLDRISGVCFGVTAPDALLPVAEALVIEMGGEPVVIAEDDRTLYHAALAIAANHLVTLIAESADLLRGAGVPDPARMLGPLVSAALDNALRLGIAGLTGPVARGDAGTVASHIEAMRNAASPAAVAAYMAMARVAADKAIAAGMLKPGDAERLLGVLGGAPR